MNIPALFLALTTVLVLQSGDRIVVEDGVREENGVVYFRAGGLLYSMPARELAQVTTLEPVEAEPQPPAPEEAASAMRRLRVSGDERQRLIAELEKNHTGTPSPPLRMADIVAPPPTAAEEAAKRDEWSWRRQARRFEEAVRRAKEDLALLETQAEELRFRILTLVSLGYKTHQFSYDTTQLAYTRERIPHAKLAVQRAERAWEEFREDARRQGVMPGWLR